tara:strand:- start:4378 stop:5340 length:963 start_codon:yes stop_codon:yes gene_type:complete
MSHTIKDKNRREVTLTTSKVGEVVPSYYEGENPQLLSLLDKYYEFLDSDGTKAFSRAIKDLHHVRDIAETDIKYLDELIKEIGNGLQASTFFQNPRLMAMLLGGFYRSKGTLVSIEGFFRGFFNEEVTVEYPKDQIFIVGESQTGFDSQKFIQDNELYQIFSILLKVGISTQDYESLYKKFVHPAGFHFAGQVASIEEATLSLSAFGLIDSDTGEGFILSSEFALSPSGQTTELTALIDSGASPQAFRVGVNQIISLYTGTGMTAGELSNFYPTIATLLSANSFTLDDSASPDSSGPDMSLTVETMDNDMFTRYTSDSTI